MKFRFFKGLLVDMRLLLEEIKHDFAGLVSLDLSFKMVFGLTKEVLGSFERLFGRIGVTLKNLSLDFSGNRNSVVNFAEGMGEIIMRNLPKLASLCLNFERTWLSTRVVRLLINGTCSHLRDLKSLVMKVGSCYVAKEELNAYKKSLASNLVFLKVDFYGSFDLSIQYLSILQNDIERKCPKLEGLYLRTLNCKRFSNEFYLAMEREFLERLKNLKRFRLLYSNEQQYLWNTYQDIEAMEFDKAQKIEEEVWKIKQRARGEDEVRIYFETLIEEDEEYKVLEEDDLDEQDYLQYQLEKELFEMDKREIGEQEMVAEEFVEEDRLYLTYDPREREAEENDLKEIYGRMEEEEAAQDMAEAEIRLGFRLGLGGDSCGIGITNDL